MQDEEILLRIKREWTKDEAVAIVLKELSESKKANGILQSDLDEMTYNFESLKNDINSKRLTKKQWYTQDETMKDLTRKIAELENVIRAKNKDIDHYRNKWIAFQLEKPLSNDVVS